MAQPYVGEIRIFAGNFAPAGWMFCQGQSLPISENETLYQLIGTTYGGDGQETFNLPNLGGRIPLHTDNSQFPIAQAAGVEEVTLSVQQIPVHDHSLFGSLDPGVQSSPQGAVPGSFAVAAGAQPYGQLRPIIPINPSTIVPAGGSQPHTNMQPYLAMSFIISLYGIFPSPT